jgi:hypothetical protein
MFRKLVLVAAICLSAVELSIAVFSAGPAIPATASWTNLCLAHSWKARPDQLSNQGTARLRNLRHGPVWRMERSSAWDARNSEECAVGCVLSIRPS